MDPMMHKDWKSDIKNENATPYFDQVKNFLHKRIQAQKNTEMIRK